MRLYVLWTQVFTGEPVVGLCEITQEAEERTQEQVLGNLYLIKGWVSDKLPVKEIEQDRPAHGGGWEGKEERGTWWLQTRWPIRKSSAWAKQCGWAWHHQERGTARGSGEEWLDVGG